MVRDKRKDAEGRFLDNPDGVRTTKESLFDMHEDMQTVDAIPVEDLTIELKDEEFHHHTKNRSASSERYLQ
ncbi:hypothetical protein C7437_10868 [Psychrobacillus insolitus]|uniref:Uncharacterized protein n=1 Tax=Psychrobacillus insolitus TaxID=1461 RepID=A0A2W7MF79_9BACI|nr:hypothetical protein [Psychrobacillus insolitus]PZX02973.1 hypothetical protein C7437_10868 [Psychrobacillus insolitus]